MIFPDYLIIKFVSLSFRCQIFNFFHLSQKNKCIFRVFGGNKGFLLRIFVRKTKVTKFVWWAKLSHLLKVLLSLKWLKITVKHQSKIWKLSWRTVIVRNLWTMNENTNLNVLLNDFIGWVLMGLPFKRYKLHSAISEIGSLAMCSVFCLAISSFANFPFSLRKCTLARLHSLLAQRRFVLRQQLVS